MSELRDGERVRATRTLVETAEGTVVIFNGKVLLDSEEPGPWGDTVRRDISQGWQVERLEVTT